MFSQNYANISGSTLYGGLLDRCAVSPFAEVYKLSDENYEYKGNGESYLKDVSTGQNTLISSLPVRVCLCISDEHSCNLANNIKVKKGETFTLSVIAVDQVGQPVSATIQTALHFTESGLAEGQLARRIPQEGTYTQMQFLAIHNSTLEKASLVEYSHHDASMS